LPGVQWPHHLPAGLLISGMVKTLQQSVQLPHSLPGRTCALLSVAIEIEVDIQVPLGS
jgi:hypothetical protein